jgi:glycosyltransferase involved in cell wall biosynthesis
LGDDEELVHSELTGFSAILPRKVAGILGMCADWDTLDGHAARIAARGLAPALAEDVQSLISEFAQKQLLASEETVRSGFKRAAQSSVNTETHIGSLVIVTRNRPDTLLRCVQSYIDNIRVFKREIDIVVFDDSDDIGLRNRAVAALSAVAHPANVKLFYYGPEHKAEFARRLAISAKCELEIVRFAICRDPNADFAVGASRNASLLTTHGQMFVTVDDDTVCDLGDVPELQPGLRLSSTPDPTEWWLVADRDEARRLAPTRELEEEGELHFDSINSSFLQGVMESNASVGVCAMGLKGDCTLFVPFLYLTFEGASYTRLVRSESVYRNAFVSREVVRSAPQITISNTATYITNNLAIDNRKLLPPFLPKQYGEDILFGMLVNCCRRDTFSGHLPLALLHDADPARRFNPTLATECAPGMQAAHILAMLIERFGAHLQSQTPEDNFAALGRYFQMLGAESPEQFYGFIQREWLNQTAWSIALLKKRIARLAHTAPTFFLDDLRKLLGTLRTALLKASPMPLDMTPNRNAAEAWQSFQQLLASYGQLLEHWPRLVDSTRALNTTPHSCALAIASSTHRN